MKVTVWFLVFAVMVPLTVRAGDICGSWSKQDLIFQGLLTVLILVDLEQTKQWENHGLKETNSVLGSKPTTETTNTLIGLGVIGHAGVTCYISPALRPYWQLLFIGMEITAVRYNHSNGIRIAVSYGF